MADDQVAKFGKAAADAAKGFYLEALSQFREIIDADPRGNLADDAAYNISICYLRTGQLTNAAVQCEKVLSEYPDSMIAQFAGSKEFGRTGAKALLALVNISVASGDKSKANGYLERLREYADSYIVEVDAHGAERRVSFVELAERLLES